MNDTRRILVTGGTGYIGSHTLIDLIENGFAVVCADNFYNSKPSVLDRIEEITGVRVKNYAIDLGDAAQVQNLFNEETFDGAIHFAAYKSVGESVEQPLAYFRNNLNSLMNVIDGLAGQGRGGNLVFSSSCSVYGNADELPVTESTPRKQAESPYARTKQMGEDILYDFCRAQPAFRAILLRYFNPVGAHPSGKIGEDASNPASNLVPVITEVAAGKRPTMTVFGDDYPTRDGSGLRDYIHVADLAHAHTLAVQRLLSGAGEENPALYNLGIGAGLTVLEVIEAFEKVSGKTLDYTVGPRRPGDIAAIYADIGKAHRELGWTPKYGVEEIMRTAWAWEQVR